MRVASSIAASSSVAASSAGTRPPARLAPTCGSITRDRARSAARRREAEAVERGERHDDRVEARRAPCERVSMLPRSRRT
jgi:hypothetical protein